MSDDVLRAVEARMSELQLENMRLRAEIVRIQAGDYYENHDADMVLQQLAAAGEMFTSAKLMLPRMHKLSIEGVDRQDLVQLRLSEMDLIAAMEGYEAGYYGKREGETNSGVGGGGSGGERVLPVPAEGGRVLPDRDEQQPA